jgi:hypothetical protein
VSSRVESDNIETTFRQGRQRLTIQERIRVGPGHECNRGTPPRDWDDVEMKPQPFTDNPVGLETVEPTRDPTSRRDLGDVAARPGFVERHHNVIMWMDQSVDLPTRAARLEASK